MLRMKPLSSLSIATLVAFAALSGCKNEEGKLAVPDIIAEYLPASRDVWPDAAGAVESPSLASVCSDLWEFQMKSSPTWATYLGDPRYNGDLADNGPLAAYSRQSMRRGFLGRLAGIETKNLSPADLLTYELLQRNLRDAIGREERDFGAWNVSPRGGPQVYFLTLASEQPIGTPRERADLLSRWRAMPGFIRREGKQLERALGEGRVASRTQVEKVLAQLDNLLATPSAQSPLVAPATGGGRWVDLKPKGNLASIAARELGSSNRANELRQINLQLLDGLKLAKGTSVLIPATDDLLTPKIRGRFLADVWTTVDEDIYPAFREYRRILETEILPNARPDDRPGILFVPGGKAAYQDCIQSFTSLSLDAETIHAIGTEEVAKVNADMLALGKKLFGVGKVGNLKSLRAVLTSDASMHYASREEIEATANRAISRMQAALPTVFGRLPLAPLEVVRVPAHEEAFTSMAYYRGPTPDGSRPGRFYVNTFDPASKPRWESEALAFHEGVPGHHLQISIANELEGLPMVRRHMGIGAFVEGWGLYAEQLADEMGMYSSDTQLLGKLSFDAWRSARLVVDTGLHAMGWSRDRAIRYLEEHTLADHRNIENEVDRYISWPGQALGYKLGELEILKLRSEAKAALGSRFNLATFHDLVLNDGPITLPLLRAKIEAWIEAETAPASLAGAEPR